MQNSAIGLLLDATIKGTVLLIAATAFVVVLRRASAASRHLVWQFALLGVLCLPLAKVVSPFQFAVLPELRSPIATPAIGGQEVRRSGGQAIEKRNNEVAPDRQTAQTPDRPKNNWALTAVRYAGFAWMIVSAILLGRLLLGFVLVRWFALRAYPLYEEGWAELNAEACALMGIKGSVTLFASPHIATPMTWGVVNPVVMMPSAAEDWTMERRRVVLLHELAHVRRRDSLMHMFAHFACALYWFHPLVWKAAARMRAEAERACDDLVLRTGTKASVYADHLLELIRTIGGMKTPALALPMAQRSTFEGRLLAILEPHVDRTAPKPLSVAGGLLVVAFMVLPLAGLTTASAINPNVADRKSKSPAESDYSQAPTTYAADTKAIQEAISEATMGIAVSTATDISTKLASGMSQKMQSNSVAVRALIVALGDADPEVRMNSVQALGQLEDTTSVTALINALRTDSDAGVRRAAAWALGQIESARAVPALVAAMQNDSDREVRATAVWALGQIEDDAAVPGLVTALRSNDVEMRKQAAWALGQIEHASAVPGLITALKDDNAEVRSQAVWALGQIEAESAVSALVSILNDPNSETRKQVAWALGQIESATAVPGLGNLLRTDKDPEVRQQAAWALGQIEDDDAVPALSAALKDGNAEVRKQAAWALGQIEAHPVAPALLEALKDSDREVRVTAAWAIGQIEDPAAAPALRAAMKDSDPEVRRTVLHALTELGDDMGYQALADMLKDPDPEVRKAAAQALGGHGGNPDPRPQPRPQPRPRPRPIN